MHFLAITKVSKFLNFLGPAWTPKKYPKIHEISHQISLLSSKLKIGAGRHEPKASKYLNAEDGQLPLAVPVTATRAVDREFEFFPNS